MPIKMGPTKKVRDAMPKKKQEVCYFGLKRLSCTLENVFWIQTFTVVSLDKSFGMLIYYEQSCKKKNLSSNVMAWGVGGSPEFFLGGGHSAFEGSFTQQHEHCYTCLSRGDPQKSLYISVSGRPTKKSQHHFTKTIFLHNDLWIFLNTKPLKAVISCMKLCLIFLLLVNPWGKDSLFA